MQSNSVNRRAVLVTAGGVALAGLAGCSGVTQHSFEASPVVLPEDVREELVLAETARDSLTEGLEVEEVDGEVSLTNQFASYARGPARGRPTLLEKFHGRVNGTESAGPAVVVFGGEFGLDGGAMDYVDWIHDATDQVSLVVPEGVRSGDNTASQPIPDSMMLLGKIANPSPVSAAITSDTDNSGAYIVDAEDFFPGSGRTTLDPIDRGWMLAGYTGADDVNSEDTVLVVLGDNSPEEVFGIAAAEMPGEPIEAGESFGSTNPFLVAAPGDVAIHEDAPFINPQEVFEAGVQAPLGGATFGVGVLSTPAAAVAGQSVNPLAHVGFRDILTSDRGRKYVPRFGSADAPDDAPDWLSGPTPVSDGGYGGEWVSDNPDGTTIIDQETDLESFLGVVSGEDGPWGVGVHMARVEYEDDIVIAAGTHYWPVGSSEYFTPFDDIITPFDDILLKATKMSDVAFERLAVE